MEIGGERAYPIYFFTYRWSQPYEKLGEYDKTDGLPPGRKWNSTRFSKMFKEELSEEELNEILEKGKAELIADKQAENLSAEGKLKEYETWMLTWFCHETFNDRFRATSTGFEKNNYDDAIHSFEKYVRRNEDRDRDENISFTLMGGEDRYRWRGEHDGDPAPCRCVHCFDQGKIRINH